MRRPTNRQRRLVILTLAVLAFGMAYYSGSRYKAGPQPAPAISGVAIHPPSPLPDLSGSDIDALMPESLSEHWSLLMLDPHTGETRSSALVRLVQIHNRLAGNPDLQRQLDFLYLPATLDAGAQAAIDGLGDNLHALTGNGAQVEVIFRRFGTDPQGEAATLYLIGPQVQLRALFTPDQDIATIAEDLTRLITQE
jgi:hypothetical protein